jgi:hypothetical protein
VAYEPFVAQRSLEYWPLGEMKQKSADVYPNNKPECKTEFNLLPKGYLQRK